MRTTDNVVNLLYLLLRPRFLPRYESMTPTFTEIFGSKESITWLQECARAVLVFGYGLLLVRLAGRRVFGKWAALDIIVSIIVGSSLSRVLTGSAPVGGTLAATSLIVALHWAMAQGAARWPKWSQLVEGSPIALGHAGSIERSKMLANGISRSDVEEALRQRGVGQVEETRLIMLEPSGKITVLRAAPGPEARGPTPRPEPYERAA